MKKALLLCGIFAIASICTVSLNAKSVVFYLKNLPIERIGTWTDEEIKSEIIDRGFTFIEVDCSDFPSTRTEFEQALIDFHASTPSLLTDYPEVDVRYVFLVPEGYLIQESIPVWSIKEHGAEGSVDRVMSIYNDYIVSEYGVEPVTDPDDMIDLYGNPIDWYLRADIIYPSGDAEDVPLVINNASNSPRMLPYSPESDEGSIKSLFPFGFVTSGYALAIIDHCYNPLARNEVYKYFDSYSLEDWNGLSSATAFVRYFRANAAEYNLNGLIGDFGISKASYTAIRLADTLNAEGEEHYLFNGITNEKEQPWLGYPSDITVAYAASGNGTRRVAEYVNENSVPLVSSVGKNDEYGHWDVFPEVVSQYNKVDNPHLCLWMEELGHIYPISGTDVATGLTRYNLFKDFFDFYLKPETHQEDLQVYYILPKEGVTDVGIDGSNRTLVHDGLLPLDMLDVSPYSPITVQFLDSIEATEIAQYVVVREYTTQQIVEGSWQPIIKKTGYEFTPNSSLAYETTYEIVVNEGITSLSGATLKETMTRSFDTQSEPEEEIIEEIYITPTDDSFTTTVLGTSNKGSETTIRVRYSTLGDWRFDGYFKFDISSLATESVESVILNLSTATVIGVEIDLAVYLTDNDWTESTLLSATKPDFLLDGEAIASLSVVGSVPTCSFDLTKGFGILQDDGETEMSIVIRGLSSGSTENIYFNSKECGNEELFPQLAVKVSSPVLDVVNTEKLVTNTYFVKEKTIYFKEPLKQYVTIYDMAGRVATVIAKGLQEDNLSNLTKGIYFFQLDNNTYKIAL